MFLLVFLIIIIVIDLAEYVVIVQNIYDVIFFALILIFKGCILLFFGKFVDGIFDTSSIIFNLFVLYRLSFLFDQCILFKVLVELHLLFEILLHFDNLLAHNSLRLFRHAHELLLGSSQFLLIVRPLVF